MDKLELDDRVSRLEQRVSAITALILVALVLFGVSAAFLLMTRSDVTISPPMATPMIMTELKTAAPAIRDPSDGSIKHLVDQLRGLAELEQKSVLSPIEFQSKKTQMLAKPIRSLDLKAELEQIADLQNKNILNPIEFQEIKTKILASGK